jgi:hypothetical protein
MDITIFIQLLETLTLLLYNGHSMEVLTEGQKVHALSWLLTFQLYTNTPF